MVGAIALIVAMLIFFPLVFLGGNALAGILGWALKVEGEASHPGSELIDLNR
ncbi:MAG TPA: hypothetical protein VFK42_16075 [Acidimicrobiales bacterium]|nr:hypothetical protein [Acidimicrobiales bacterium]